MEVEKAFKEAFKGDKARMRMGRISPFGLLEMSRQRLRPTLESHAYETCPQCKGSGRVKSAEAQALQVYRRIQGAAAKKSLIRVEGELPLETARFLLNEMRSELASLEKDFGVKIDLKFQPAPLSQDAHIRLVRARKTGEGANIEDLHL